MLHHNKLLSLHLFGVLTFMKPENVITIYEREFFQLAIFLDSLSTVPSLKDKYFSTKVKTFLFWILFFFRKNMFLHLKLTLKSKSLRQSLKNVYSCKYSKILYVYLWNIHSWIETLEIVR